MFIFIFSNIVSTLVGESWLFQPAVLRITA
jgi:hypothetical protein